MFPILYKRDTKGRIRTWQIEVQDNKHRTVAGLIDGQKVISEWTVVEGKNVGKANETTPEEQATKEAESQVTIKLYQGGYHRDIENVDDPKFFEPMLAASYDKEFAKRFSWEENEFVAQPKLDGMRCIAKADGLWSRGGKPIVAVPHIWARLAPLFEADPDLILDGELYNHDLKDNFAKLMSLCKKQKPTPEQIKESEVVQFWIYDIPSVAGSYWERYQVIEKVVSSTAIYSRPIRECPTEWVKSQEQLDELFASWLAEGYEGQIVRVDSEEYPYQQKRSKGLLKRKTFDDAEFEIVEIEEGDGNRTGMAGRVYFKAANGDIGRAALKGSHDYCRELLAEADEYVGGQVTVQFMGYSMEDGLPRHPVAVFLWKGKRDV